MDVLSISYNVPEFTGIMTTVVNDSFFNSTQVAISPTENKFLNCFHWHKLLWFSTEGNFVSNVS